MKIRSLVSILLWLCILSNNQTILNAAQNTSQWQLPKGVIARFGKGPVNDIAFSPDGRQLAVVSDIGVWIYDALTGIELALLTKNTGLADYSVVYNPDGNTIAVIGDRKDVQLWDTRTQELKGTLPGEFHYPHYVTFSPDGQTIAIADTGGTTQLWNAITMELKFTLEGSSGLSGEEALMFFSIAFSPKGNLFAIGAEDGKVRLWDTSTGQFRYRIDGNITSPYSFSFNSDGSTIATRSNTNTVLLWDTTTGRHKKTLEDGIGKLGNSIAYSPNREMLAITAEDGLQLWNTTTGKLVNKLKRTGRIEDIVFSPDGNTIGIFGLSGKNNRNVWLWDIVTGENRSMLKGTDSIKRVAFNLDCHEIAIASTDNMVQVWNTTTRKHKFTLEHTSSVVGFSYNHDRKNLLTTVHTDKTVWLWNTLSLTGKPTIKLSDHTKDVSSVAFSSDGNMFATGSEDRTLMLWTNTTGTLIEKVNEKRFYNEPFFVGSFNQNGDTLAVGNVTGVQLMEVDPLRLKAELAKGDGPYSWIRSIGYSPDGKLITTGRDKKVEIWDAESGKLKGSIEAKKFGIESTVMSPDGKTIAFDVGNKVSLLDIATQTVKRELVIGWYCMPLAFSPDGNKIAASEGWKGTVQVFDTSSGMMEHTLKGHAGKVKSAVFSPDVNTLTTASEDGTLLLWDLTSHHLKPIRED